jgi:serine/threonine protein kinase
MPKKLNTPKEPYFDKKRIRICTLANLPPIPAPEEPRLVIDELKDLPGFGHLTEPNVWYAEGEKPDTNVGMSFVLEPSTQRKWPKLFLKLAVGEKDDISQTSYSRVKRHLIEEFKNLVGVNELERSNCQVGHVAKVLAIATLHYKHKQIPALLEEYVDGTPLDKWLTKLKSTKISEKQFLAVWLMLAFPLTNIVRRLHNHGVIHGWIQPRHIILKKSWNTILHKGVEEITDECATLVNEVHLVGFGTSAFLFEPERGEVTRRIMKPDPFAAPEVKREGRVEGLFSYPVDLFSLGATLLLIALDMRRPGFNPETLRPIFEAQTVERLKRAVAESLRDVQWTTESVARIVDKAIRPDQEDRFLCAEEMLQFILNAADADLREHLLNAVLSREEVDEPIEELGQHLTAAVAKRDDAVKSIPNIAGSGATGFLTYFFKDRVYETCAWQGLSAFNEKGHLEIYGSRDTLLDWLCAFMGLLQKGDQYCTRTIPAYWTDNNLGATGRFLVKNKDLAIEGVEVKRLFMVTHDFDELAINEQMALLEQRLACTSVWEELEKKKRPRSEYDVRVMKVSEVGDLLQVERRHQFVAYVKFGEESESKWRGQQVGFSFMSHGGQYQEFDKGYLRAQITKLRFRSMSQDEDDTFATQKFVTDFKMARALDEYLNTGAELKDLMAKL